MDKASGITPDGKLNRKSGIRPTAAVMTLGCKVNYYESEKLIGELIDAGFKIVGYDEYADVYVVNTCTVTNIADRKSRKMLHRAKRSNRDPIVVALGCFAQAKGEELLSDTGIDLAIGNDKKDNACEIIVEAYEEAFRENDTRSSYEQAEALSDKSADHYNGINTPEESLTEAISSGLNERTRAYVKIQDGCNQFCSYCKIPYVRGKLKSTDTTEVVQHIRELAENDGYKEVVLTGIHLSSYGVDLLNNQPTNNMSFVELEGRPLLELISEVSKIAGIRRIRLGSLEPRIITESFIKNLSAIPKVCPHFHLSLQSGCDKTLKNMNRKYTAEEYLVACGIIRQYYDRPAITTDIIVGFPGETDEDFNECLAFAKEVHFADMHVFKYSKRDGTRAAVMSDQVPESVKNERSRILIEAGRKLTAEYIDLFMDEEQKVLVEEKITIDGKPYYTGHNERYIKLIFPYTEGEMLENEIISVRPYSVGEDNVLAGKPNTP